MEEKKLLRKAIVYYQNEIAGYLTELPEEYEFVYAQKFLDKNISISQSLPAREEPYLSKDLFAFFYGLLPEGWYLDIVSATKKIDPHDAFGLLLGTADIDTIGVVTVRRDEDEK